MNAYELGFKTESPEVTLDNLPVQGQLPNWLQGTLVRNGPGTFEVGQQQYRHWFDGLAMQCHLQLYRYYCDTDYFFFFYYYYQFY